jgi:hypothetical protein
VVTSTITIVYCPTYIYRKGWLTIRLSLPIILNYVDVEGWSLEETYTAVYVVFFVEIVKMDLKSCFYTISLDFTDFTQF